MPIHTVGAFGIEFLRSMESSPIELLFVANTAEI